MRTEVHKPVVEHPVLFSGEMVRAILEGRKTQTRRVVKPQPELNQRLGLLWKGHYYGIRTDGLPYLKTFVQECPYGVPGDRLWVRETWARVSDGEKYGVCYRVDGEDQIDGEAGERWRPSIFMPRQASRITLEITGVRVQRVQEISEEDAIAEGIQIFGATPVEILTGLMATMKPVTRRAFLASALAVALGLVDVLAGRRKLTNREAFAVLWDRINAKRGYGWRANPWAWAISFRRIGW